MKSKITIERRSTKASLSRRETVATFSLSTTWKGKFAHEDRDRACLFNHDLARDVESVVYKQERERERERIVPGKRGEPTRPRIVCMLIRAVFGFHLFSRIGLSSSRQRDTRSSHPLSSPRLRCYFLLDPMRHRRNRSSQFAIIRHCCFKRERDRRERCVRLSRSPTNLLIDVIEYHRFD